jgi:hypothetical protein
MVLVEPPVALFVDVSKNILASENGVMLDYCLQRNGFLPELHQH